MHLHRVVCLRLFHPSLVSLNHTFSSNTSHYMLESSRRCEITHYLQILDDGLENQVPRPTQNPPPNASLARSWAHCGWSDIACLRKHDRQLSIALTGCSTQVCFSIFLFFALSPTTVEKTLGMTCLWLSWQPCIDLEHYHASRKQNESLTNHTCTYLMDSIFPMISHIRPGTGGMRAERYHIHLPM